MQQINQSDSIILENDHNQFLSEYLQYESCPFCYRSFFRGKLAYHLKLCSSQNPMIKSNKVTGRHTKNILSAPNNYQRCSNCSTKIPSYIAQKHMQWCYNVSEKKLKKSQQTKQSFKSQQKAQNIERSQKMIRLQKMDKMPQETIFPKIRDYASQDSTKTRKKIIIKSTGPNVIKIRQQLRCYNKAQQVQQIQCQFCSRKFSKQAAQRHLPICMILKQKQKKQIVFFKDKDKQTKNAIVMARKLKLQGLGKSYQVISSKTFIAEKKEQKGVTSALIKHEANLQADRTDFGSLLTTTTKQPHSEPLQNNTHVISSSVMSDLKQPIFSANPQFPDNL